ncbi:MAG: right-handed parallel beta-helix repeat-containing protein [Candidatus Micrarchaeota archaeon]
MRANLAAVLVCLLPILLFSANCSEIGVNGTIYSSIVLSEDLTSFGDCLLIGRDNVTLDCAGHSLTGAGGGTGLYIFGKRSVEVKNCLISGFNYGIYASFSESSFFTGNKISKCYIGIIISSSSALTFEKNSVDENGQGIYAYGLQDSIISGVNARNNKGHGLELRSSVSNKIKSNDFSGNLVGLGIYSSSDIEVKGNDLRACYTSYKESTVRGVVLSDNAQDIISGSGWVSIFKDVRSMFAIGIVIVILGGTAYIMGLGRPKKPGKGGLQLDKFDFRDIGRTKGRD